MRSTYVYFTVVAAAFLALPFSATAQGGQIELLGTGLSAEAIATTTNPSTSQDFELLPQEALAAVVDRSLTANVNTDGTASSQWQGRFEFRSSAESLTLTGAITESVSANALDDLNELGCPTADAVTRYTAFVDIRVTGAPLTVFFEQAGTVQADAGAVICGGPSTGRGRAFFRGLRAADMNGGGSFFAPDSERLCSVTPLGEAGPQFCGNDGRETSFELAPGDYRLTVAGECFAESNGIASSDFTFTMQIGTPEPCNLFWDENTALGEFTEPSNWSGNRVPEDDGDGCDNLTVAGISNSIFINGVQAANSLTLAELGEKRLITGGSGRLRLGGRTKEGDFTFGLSVLGSRAFVDGVVLEVDNMVIDSGSGSIQAGLVLTAEARLFASGEDLTPLYKVGDVGSGALVMEDGSSTAGDFQVGTGRSGGSGAPLPPEFFGSEIVVKGNDAESPVTIMDGGLTILDGPERARVRVENGGSFLSDFITVSAGEAANGVSRPGNVLEVIGRNSSTQRRASVLGPLLVLGNSESPLEAVARVEDGELFIKTTVVGNFGTGRLLVSGDSIFETTDLQIASSSVGFGDGVASFAEGLSPSPSAQSAVITVSGKTEVGLTAFGVLEVTAEPNSRPANSVVMNTVLIGARRGQGEGSGQLLVSGRTLEANSIQVRGKEEGDGLIDLSDGGRLFIVDDADGGSLDVGLEGVGTLEMTGEQSGAPTSITTRAITVGRNGGSGLLTVSGNSSIDAREMTVPFIDFESPGTIGFVRLQDGALLSLSETLEIGIFGAGTVTVSGGVLSADELINIAARGALFVEPQGTVISPRVRVIQPQGRIVGISERGTKQGVGTPGRIQGNVELAEGAILQLDASAGSGPALLVEGDLLADGTLEVVFPEGDGVAANDTFELMSITGETSGSFDTVVAPNRTSDFAATASIEDGTLRMVVQNPGQPLDNEGETEGVVEEGEEEGEGVAEGEGEGDDEPVPPAGCSGCDNKSGPIGTSFGDLFLLFFGLTSLLAGHLHLRRQGMARVRL